MPRLTFMVEIYGIRFECRNKKVNLAGECQDASSRVFYENEVSLTKHLINFIIDI